MAADFSNFSVSAKIYEFPPRGRFAGLSKQRDQSVPLSPEQPLSLEQQLQPHFKIASGAGWYHDEAIAAEQRRKD